MVSSQAAGWWYCNERETWQGAGRAKKGNPVVMRSTMQTYQLPGTSVRIYTELYR